MTKVVYVYEKTDYCKRTDAPCDPHKCGCEKDSCIFLVRGREIADEPK